MQDVRRDDGRVHLVAEAADPGPVHLLHDHRLVAVVAAGATVLFAGILVAFIASLVAIFFNMPALSLAVSGMFALLMCGLILYQTQQIVRGGETNYIMATVTLFVSIYNLFLSLLQLLGFFFGED